MSRNNNTVTTSGATFCDLLAIVFIILKLTHVVEWSWLWVLAPIWIPLALVLIVIIVALIIAALS